MHVFVIIFVTLGVPPCNVKHEADIEWCASRHKLIGRPFYLTTFPESREHKVLILLYTSVTRSNAI